MLGWNVLGVAVLALAALSAAAKTRTGTALGNPVLRPRSHSWQSFTNADRDRFTPWPSPWICPHRHRRGEDGRPSVSPGPRPGLLRLSSHSWCRRRPGFAIAAGEGANRCEQPAERR